MRKTALIDNNLMKTIRLLQKMNVEEVEFFEDLRVKKLRFCEKNSNFIEKKSKNKQTRVKDREERELEILREARRLDDLMLEDPESYEDELLRQGALLGDE